jgi:hypothetical protein
MSVRNWLAALAALGMVQASLYGIDDIYGQGDTGMEVAIYALVAMFVVMIVVNILFLMTQSGFAKSMETDDPSLNTSPVWIWTQLIPVWSLVAIPVTLTKLSRQFNAFLEANSLVDDARIKRYDTTWGWVWYGGVIASMFIPVAALVALVGVTGFWVHVANVKQSLAALHKETGSNISASQE